MALDGKLLGRALDRLEELNKQDERERSALRLRVYERLPRVAWIDSAIAHSFAEAAFAALDSGSSDPEDALRSIALQNLSLQAERAGLMTEAGFAPDCLDEKPRCPQCSDRGWDGARPCSCLMALYKEEQRLEEILSAINGVGKCRVLLSVHNGGELILAEDEGETVVLSNGGTQSTVTVQTQYPAFQGAVVVAGGCENTSVRYDILSSVMAYTGLSVDRITICPMKNS